MAKGIQWKGTPPDELFTKRWRAGVLNMMAEVQMKAQTNAPILTGALRNSARIRATRDGAEVTFGSSRVDYALLRHEVNHLHPSTTKYLARAAEDVARGNLARFFK